ncbi:probable phosducin [Cephalotrichum gorgonifer]|uniref:Probable phosducin n=1 Tax=Cephalotrichum gorgonifer TaxID=2041049 RepID=A0AAE8N061_9PEZI|nr:probable phosducin [Cephalotrichum gorgonifer]
MADPTPAQEEFSRLVENNSRDDSRVHPEDRDDERRDRLHQDLTEEDEYRNEQIEAAMRIPAFDRTNGGAGLNLPPASFDSGRSTGVKGVIADARSYEMARKTRFRDAVRTARRSIFGVEAPLQGRGPSKSDSSETDGEASGSDEEAFLQEWRESRRKELESEVKSGVRNRRTSPSVRLFGRFDEVDALGYLDAIEKVGRETVVVVFVYDHECLVSREVESALVPLVTKHPAVHFVKVHYDDIEFDNAGVPAVLAYRNQGDLFANLTGIIEMIPDEDFDSDALEALFRKHSIV